MSAPLPAADGLPWPLPYVRPHLADVAAVVADIAATLATPAWTNGAAHVRALEAELSALLGWHVCATHSGGGALRGALALLERPGAVVVPAFTFAASANAVREAGRDVVWCDVDAETGTIDPEDLMRCLAAHANIAAVMPVNVYGTPPDFAALLPMCRHRGVDVIYDNAHGVGVIHRPGEVLPAGLRAACHSLHATKVLPAAEGGFVAVSSDDDRRRLAAWVNHGYLGVEARGPGSSAKLSELHAILARHGLRDLAQIAASRRATLARLRAAVTALPSAPLALLRERPEVTGNGQNFVVLTPPEDRDAWVQALATAGVASRPYFAPGLNSQPWWAQGRETPRATLLGRRALALPLWTAMPEAAVRRVIDGVGQAAAALGHG